MIEKWTKGCILSFIKKGDLGMTKNSLHNLTDSDNQSNDRRCTSKESHGNATVCRFLQSIRFHSQRKILLPKETFTVIMVFYKNTNAHLLETQTSLKKFLESCKEIRTIFVYTLPKLHTSNVNRSNKRKCFNT